MPTLTDQDLAQLALFMRDNLMRLAQDATSSPFLVAGVVIITNLLKAIFARFGAFPDDKLLSLVVQVIAWVVYVIASRFGYGDSFAAFWTNGTEVLRAFIPLVPIVLGSHAVYRTAKKNEVPILSYRATRPGEP